MQGIALAVRDIRQLSDSILLPEEAALLPANAAEKRRNQFSLGRAAARQALTDLGLPASPVLRGSSREPLWPDGIVGSITHCGPWAIAVAARRENAQSIGIDLEDSSRVVADEIVGVIANENEKIWIFAGDDSRSRLTMLFSAKESVFKAVYPLERRFFDFHAVELSWQPDENRFLARFPEGRSLEVGCQREANFIFTHARL